ncbi:DUF397 domain-containing protein [Streptomyces sedi]|uniref:DUF397 domain-containing protein n=1 Tax=Streptomyces sedi TaxID=555059 RepID=A0A5C4UXU0_9ACTN|nr:DUF397 domain-containing protein [Streptomyces sedi]TNM28422.1 DUF397 domain-containing protein [Streptomyces sedi]
MRAEHSHLSAARWRKSTHSDGGDSNCVEVADGCAGVVPVRDSKAPDHPPLFIPNNAWASFIEHLTR